MSIPHPLLEPWFITSDAFKVVIGVATRDQFFSEERIAALLAKNGTPLDNTGSRVETRGDTAIIHVKGPLFRYASMFSDISAASSYGQLRKDFQVCLDNDDVKSICWVFDSPGGEVNGCAELAQAIYQARGKKPMVAYVGGTCASAAYWLACAVGEIHVAQTALIGSIGCKAALVDDTEKQKMDGVKTIEIVSSQSPKKSDDPAKQATIDKLQQRIDDLAAVFINGVAQYRGLKASAVMDQYGQGDVMVGARAVAAGMCDAVSDMESVLAGMATKSSNYSTMGAMQMELKAMAKLLGLDESASEKQVEEQAQSLSHFHRDALTASGAKNADEALGKIRAGLVAIGERDALSAAMKQQTTAATQKEFRSELKSALKEGRLTMGELTTVIPTFMNDEEGAKATAALAACKSQERKELLDAVCAGQIGPKRLISVKAFLAARPAAVLPPPAEQPADDEKNRTQVRAVSEAQLKEFGSQYGLAPEAVSLASFNTVEEAIAAQKAAQSAQK